MASTLSATRSTTPRWWAGALDVVPTDPDELFSAVLASEQVSALACTGTSTTANVTEYLLWALHVATDSMTGRSRRRSTPANSGSSTSATGSPPTGTQARHAARPSERVDRRERRHRSWCGSSRPSRTHPENLAAGLSNGQSPTSSGGTQVGSPTFKGKITYQTHDRRPGCIHSRSHSNTRRVQVPPKNSSRRSWVGSASNALAIANARTP